MTCVLSHGIIHIISGIIDAVREVGYVKEFKIILWKEMLGSRYIVLAKRKLESVRAVMAKGMSSPNFIES